VVGVKHHGNPGHERGHAAHGAGLGGVGVDDGRPFTPHESIEAEGHPQVIERADGPAQLRNLGQLDPASPGKVEEVTLALIGGSDHEPCFESMIDQSRAQVDHMQRRPANVEAREDAQNASRRHDGFRRRRRGARPRRTGRRTRRPNTGQSRSDAPRRPGVVPGRGLGPTG
jgi:hypothetical protein